MAENDNNVVKDAVDNSSKVASPPQPVEYLVLGFEQPNKFTGNLVKYHLLKIQNGIKSHTTEKFLIDKTPTLFDTIQIKNDGVYNSFISIRNNPDLPAKMFNFLNQFDKFDLIRKDRMDKYEANKLALWEAVSSKTITQDEANIKNGETATALDISFSKGVDCVVEGLVDACTEKMTKVKVGDGLLVVVYHHELAKVFPNGVTSGDIVRIYGRLKSGIMNAAMYGVKKYVPEHKAETVSPSKPEKKTEEKVVNQGIEECEATSLESNVPPQAQSPPKGKGKNPNSGGGSGGGSNYGAPQLTPVNNYELSAEGLSYFADHLLDAMKIKVLRGSSRLMREIYVWKNGYYINAGDIDIEKAVKDELQEFYEVKWFNIVLNHILSKGSIERWQFKPPKRTLNIENGILTYPDKKVVFTKRTHPLQFHEMNFIYKIPLIYDPDAKCPELEAIIQQILVDKTIDKEHLKLQDISKAINEATLEQMADPEFMADLAEQREKALAIALGKDPAVSKLFTFYEFLGLCLMSEYEFKKALCLLAYPHAGKSTLLNIVRKFLGERNCVSVPLSKLDSSNNRFAASRLEGKWANIVEEIGVFNVKTLDVFKAATSGSVIDAEKKSKDGFDFENSAKFFLAGNEVPKIPPSIFNSAMDRVVAIECTNRFLASEKNTKSEMQHMDFTPQAMSGLLNIAIAGLERLLESGGRFTCYDSSETAILWNKYSDITNQSPMRLFIHECCNVTGVENDKVSRKDLYASYLTWMKEHPDLEGLAEMEFAKQLSQHKEQVVDSESGKKIPYEYISIGAKKSGDVRYWTGIVLNSSMNLSNPMDKREEKDEGDNN